MAPCLFSVAGNLLQQQSSASGANHVAQQIIAHITELRRILDVLHCHTRSFKSTASAVNPATHEYLTPHTSSRAVATEKQVTPTGYKHLVHGHIDSPYTGQTCNTASVSTTFGKLCHPPLAWLPVTSSSSSRQPWCNTGRNKAICQPACTPCTTRPFVQLYNISESSVELLHATVSNVVVQVRCMSAQACPQDTTLDAAPLTDKLLDTIRSDCNTLPKLHSVLSTAQLQLQHEHIAAAIGRLPILLNRMQSEPTADSSPINSKSRSRRTEKPGAVTEQHILQLLQPALEQHISIFTPKELTYSLWALTRIGIGPWTSTFQSLLQHLQRQPNILSNCNFMDLAHMLWALAVSDLLHDPQVRPLLKEADKRLVQLLQAHLGYSSSSSSSSSGHKPLGPQRESDESTSEGAAPHARGAGKATHQEAPVSVGAREWQHPFERRHMTPPAFVMILYAFGKMGYTQNQALLSRLLNAARKWDLLKKDRPKALALVAWSLVRCKAYNRDFLWSLATNFQEQRAEASFADVSSILHSFAALQFYPASVMDSLLGLLAKPLLAVNDQSRIRPASLTEMMMAQALLCHPDPEVIQATTDLLLAILPEPGLQQLVNVEKPQSGNTKSLTIPRNLKLQKWEPSELADMAFALAILSPKSAALARLLNHIAGLCLQQDSFGLEAVHQSRLFQAFLAFAADSLPQQKIAELRDSMEVPDCHRALTHQGKNTSASDSKLPTAGSSSHGQHLHSRSTSTTDSNSSDSSSSTNSSSSNTHGSSQDALGKVATKQDRNHSNGTDATLAGSTVPQPAELFWLRLYDAMQDSLPALAVDILDGWRRAYISSSKAAQNTAANHPSKKQVLERLQELAKRSKKGKLHPYTPLPPDAPVGKRGKARTVSLHALIAQGKADQLDVIGTDVQSDDGLLMVDHLVEYNGKLLAVDVVHRSQCSMNIPDHIMGSARLRHFLLERLYGLPVKAVSAGEWLYLGKGERGDREQRKFLLKLLSKVGS